MAGLFILMMICMITMPAYAAENSDTDNTQEVVQMAADENAQEDSSTGDKAMAAAVAIGLAAAAGAIGRNRKISRGHFPSAGGRRKNQNKPHARTGIC